MKKIVLLTCISLSVLQAQYNIPKLVASGGLIFVTGTFVALSYHEWPSPKKSTTKSKVLAGLTACYAIPALIALVYIHKTTY